MQVDLRYGNKDQGQLQVVVAPVLRFIDVGFNAQVKLAVSHMQLEHACAHTQYSSQLFFVLLLLCKALPPIACSSRKKCRLCI
mgnify:CR=1 FL=1